VPGSLHLITAERRLDLGKRHLITPAAVYQYAGVSDTTPLTMTDTGETTCT
jgi:hypothetical protein